MSRYSFNIEGIVQGVGFRPYIYKLAKSLQLCGYVQNTSKGVYVEVEGQEEACKTFAKEINNHPPVQAWITNVQMKTAPLLHDKDFVIIQSQDGEKKAFVSPDIGICDACISDITDKNNRRYQYAFTNCTDCGPRFTIIRDIPYDRKNTTMDEFEQCPDCRQEYLDPNDRRFHAQPNACPTCGPRLQFYISGQLQQGDPIERFKEFISAGKIVAVKGLGGYHLACDAENETAVRRLRKNKIRYDKPFAVMIRDVDTVKRYCKLDADEEKILSDYKKQIVLLEKKENCPIAKETTLDNTRLGVMLPYTPLHTILMQNHEILIMTSANISDQPMIYDDGEALNKLPEIADAILTHNRAIYRRMDDSVCMMISGKARMIRRGRGYAPAPIRLEGNKAVILSLGSQQKNTFCLAIGENAFLSGHIGDLDDIDTEKCYEAEINAYLKIFEAKPEAIACDLHPDYISTRFADRFTNQLPIYKIQHHHAHFASVLAEHNLQNHAFGLIFDGTGFGEDGALWGGELLMGGIEKSQRKGHLRYAPLLGGEAAIQEPWRMALSMISSACGDACALEYFEKYGDKATLLLQAGSRGLHSPLTSGMGRLFDAVAAITGLRHVSSFEGQAAIELENAMDSSEKGAYGFDIIWEDNEMIFDWRQLICEIVLDVKRGRTIGVIAMKFHRALVSLICASSINIRKQYDVNTAVLSGGVFQNAFLLREGLHQLEKRGFKAFSNKMIPANDGGISYGQAAVVSQLIEK